MSITPKTVLIAEDHRLVREIVAEEFADAGFRVIEASNAQEAVLVLEIETIDLLFTDIDMPGPFNGLSLAKLAQKRWPETAVIVTSGDHHLAANELAKSQTFVPKPYCSEDIVKRAKEMVLS